MKTVNVFAAQGLRESDPSPEVVITIAHPMPDDIPHERRRAFHASEAAALADALWSSLPGGTVDALLVALMDRQRSVLVVSRGREAP